MPFYLLSSFHQSVMEIFRPLLNWFDSVSMLRSLQPYRDWLPYVTVGVVLPFLLWIFLSILRQVRRNSRSGKNVRPSPAPAGTAVQGKAIDITTDFVVHDPWTEPSLGAQAAPAPQPDLSLRPQEQGISAPVPDRTNSWIAPDSAAVAVGLDIVVFIIPSELYPLRIRATAMSLTTGVNWTLSFIVSLTFLSLFDVLGGAGTFGIYAVATALLAVFAIKVIPETRGKTLEDIEREHVRRDA